MERLGSPVTRWLSTMTSRPKAGAPLFPACTVVTRTVAEVTGRRNARTNNEALEENSTFKPFLRARMSRSFHIRYELLETKLGIPDGGDCNGFLRSTRLGDGT